MQRSAGGIAKTGCAVSPMCGILSRAFLWAPHPRTYRSSDHRRSSSRTIYALQERSACNSYDPPCPRRRGDGMRCVGVQSCVRPVCAVMTAGPDGFRGRGPILLCGLRRPRHYGGLFSSPVRPVRHHPKPSQIPCNAGAIHTRQSALGPKERSFHFAPMPAVPKARRTSRKRTFVGASRALMRGSAKPG